MILFNFEPNGAPKFGGFVFFLYLCTEFQKPTAMKKILSLCLLLLVIATSIALSSCNVTRTVTTQSQYYQRGDTAVVIQTKTIETYDASERVTKMFNY